jgi:pyruvate dehydrogenase E2 component (dihydrolipoamide acetyltransferase)
VAIMVDELEDVAAFKTYDHVITNIEESIIPPKVGGDTDVAPIKQMETLDYTAHTAVKTPEKVEVPVRTAGSKVFISPYAKKTAQEEGVDYNNIKGTGPKGRIVYDDIMSHLKSGAGSAGSSAVQVAVAPQQVQAQVPTQVSAPTTPVSAPVQTQTQTPSGSYQDVQVSNMRKVIAERLVLSKTTIPHFYITVECNMDEIIR